MSQNCRNFNHGRMNVSIQYCPVCGEKFNSGGARSFCGAESHKSKLKNRDIYCCDCGEKLAKTNPNSVR